MNRVTLPSIGNNAQDEQKSPHFYEETMGEEDNYNENIFAHTSQKLTGQPFPQLNDQSSVKNRIAVLERTAEVQADFNKLSHRTFMNLAGDLKLTEDSLKDIINQVQNNFDSKLATMKKEYDHRFELQANENKRLQNHVATLKGDSHILKKKLQSTIEKLRKLQVEFGDGDVELEEESILSATGASTLSRPNTTGQL